MKATDRRRFGRSGLDVTALGFGGGTIGNIFKALTEAAWIEHPIPADLWTELKAEGLLRQDAPVPAS